MVFINEKMKADDVQRFRIERIDNTFKTDGLYSRSWTVDRDSNMYLRGVARLGHGTDTLSIWTFYWYGELLKVVLKPCGDCKQPDDLNCPGWRLDSITEFYSGELLPDVQQFEVLEDLRLAFAAYRPGLDDPSLDIIISLDRQDAQEGRSEQYPWMEFMTRMQELRDSQV